MKPTALLCAWILGAASLLAQPVTVPALGPRFKQTRERTEVLFGHRNGTYPAPDPRISLFQNSGVSRVASPVEKAPEPEPVGSDETLLHEALTVLAKGKGGFVNVKGQAHLAVGPRVYREGDSISVPLRSGNVALRVTRITSNSATLTLNESEVVWRF